MTSLGLRQSNADPCLFYSISGNEKLIVVLYVDDGLVATINKASINGFLTSLEYEFKITVEPLGSFLNVLINRQKNGSIFISQKGYAESIFKRFNMEDANPVSVPIEKCQLIEDSGGALINVPYREAIGCLMYLAVATRPDIAYVVNYASQFLEEPKQKHWILVKRIFKYIKGTAGLGIHYKVAERTGKFEVFSDADYASDSTTQRSVSGIVLTYSGGAIVWANEGNKTVYHCQPPRRNTLLPGKLPKILCG